MRVAVSSLELKDGTRVGLADPGVTIFVGPNNSGKTQVLREIVTALDGGEAPLKLLTGVEINKEGSADDFLGWLKEEGLARPNDPRTGYETSYDRTGYPIGESTVRNLWDNHPVLAGLRQLLVGYHPTEARQHLLGGQPLPNLYEYEPRRPIQALYSDREGTERLSELVERAFGVPITLNRYGAELRLHWGVPSEPESLPPPSRAYLESLMRVPLIGDQGDGVRSFVGLLLDTMVSLPLVLIDEPEAFLHPPNARLLGRVLVERTPENGQLIIATHSDDVLQGVLEVRNRRIRLIRQSRGPFGNQPGGRLGRVWRGPSVPPSGGALWLACPTTPDPKRLAAQVQSATGHTAQMGLGSKRLSTRGFTNDPRIRIYAVNH